MKDVTDGIIRPALDLLPPQMASDEAVAMLLAIGMQESRFAHRIQVRGPARGFWQFERIGLVEVATGRLTREHFLGVCRQLRYPPELDFLFEGLAHNDILVCCAARLLLWPDRAPLPSREHGPDVAWDYYIRRWCPGKPHRHTWNGFWEQAWSAVSA